MDSMYGRYFFMSIISILMLIALILAIILGFSVKKKFEGYKLNRDLEQVRIEQQLNSKE